jgi:hypothetical protein
MWPKRFRKQKPYTAAELESADCEGDAKKILAARGSGEIVRIAPPDEETMRLGPVGPPVGGVIDTWYYHHVVRDDGRFFDKMTEPDGMTEDEYRVLFEYWDELTIRVVSHEDQ